MSTFRVVRRMFCVAAETAAAPVAGSRWERLKKSKAGVWCRGLVTDYKEACREIFVGAWERPIKASVYGTLLGGALACFYTKPDQSSFEAALLDRSNELGLLSPWIRNATSDGHVQSLVKLRNEGRLRHISFGLLSLVYRADYDLAASLYEAQCSNLSVPWRELHQRVLDVGFVGFWWVLDSKMKDYDVNDDEFKHLPVYMQHTAAPSVQEVERSERLHKESWLPPAVEEEEAGTKVVDRKEEVMSEESQIKEEQTPA
ncbi:mitochondrial import inner membrane translocase subunit Tim29 [Notolabrus celidotus]|uniref:mitochondrial import inner membrane translocase subunit Tim29 n=1 Tax=Notolabrus celidotus TaxID=1203425 RepID=UPI0014900A92|nr:mitochondrial import inner membrane translocase subunit Tim29 [Notolabrus celidotus]